MANYTDPARLAADLRQLADDQELLWAVPRRAIEDQLIAFRDSRLSFPLRNNGLVVREKDGTPSDVIRLGPEMAVATALRALAEHLDPTPNTEKDS